ncbi:MAG: hypothetical protein ABJB03_03135 [Rhodoglobus sp.]
MLLGLVHPKRMPQLSSQRHAQSQRALERTLALQPSKMLLDSGGATFAGLDGQRPTTPRDESHTQVKREPVEQAHATNQVLVLA